MPTIATREKGESGDILRYVNGYVFEGEYDSKGKPVDGIIRDPNGNTIYISEIEGDIFEYFNLDNR